MSGLRRAAWLLAALASAGAAGCVSLNRPYAAVREYVIEAPPAAKAAAAAAPAGTILKVRNFRVAPPFDSRKFVYRRGDGAWESDYYHELLAPPGAMLAGVVERSLAASGSAGAVVPSSSQASPTFELEGTIQEWYADYRDASDPRAALSIEFILLDIRGATRIALHKTYREEAKLEKAGPEALVQGWSEALGRILTSLGNDLATADWTAPR
jgi:uncharacterized lipoprotein YmbA